MDVIQPSAPPTSVLASSIVDGDTTHAPTGNAVFDALALKVDGPVGVKRYVALLSQSGNGTSTQTSGVLSVGKRYKITDYQTGDDFTNVGAASNATNVEFVATGTTPTVWTEGSELTDTAAPVATVLENSLGGSVVWTYENSGRFIGTLVGAFAGSVPTTNGFNDAGADGSVWTLIKATNDDMNLHTLNLPGDTFTNGLLANTRIEITVYPS